MADKGFASAGVLGQYFFDFEIDGAGDFLGDSGQIHQFIMEERIGGDVPVFELTFSTTDSSILTKINEGSIIQCRFGRDVSDLQYSEMVIQSFNHHVEGADYWIVTLGGILAGTSEYLGNIGQKAHKDKTSKDAMIEEAKVFFTIYDETETETKDEQTWLKMGTSPMKFINDTWKHSYITEDNFLMYGIDFYGNFIVKDLKALLKQEIRWTLSHDMPASDTTAAYHPDLRFGSEFGLMNHLSLYQKAGFYHDGATEDTVVEQTPKLSTTLIDGDLNITSDGAPILWEVPKIFDKDNVHENFNVSRYINTTRNVLQNSVELNIVIENKWQAYQLFDLIDFVPYRPNVTSDYSVDTQTLAGTYAITRISRFFGDNRAAIEITISRDGINGIEGTDLYTYESLDNITWDSLSGIGDSIGDGVSSIFSN